MSGGAQQLVFSMLVQVFIGGRMYLDMTRNGIPTSPDAADTLHIQSMSFYGITHFIMSANFRTAGDPVKLRGKSVSSDLDVF